MIKSRKYPGTSIEDCIDFIKKVEKFNGPVGYSQMADVYEVSTSTNSFKMRVSSSKQFGFIDADGQKIELTKIGRSYLFPVSEDSKDKILYEAVYKPQLYKELIDKYNGKQVPSINALSNILLNDFSIIKTSKDAAAKAFIDTMTYVGIVKNGILTYSSLSVTPESTGENESSNKPIENVVDQNQETIPMKTTKDEILDEFIEQKYETENGKYAKIIIPRDATKDDLIALSDMFKIILKRKFKIKEDDFN